MFFLSGLSLYLSPIETIAIVMRAVVAVTIVCHIVIVIASCQTTSLLFEYVLGLCLLVVVNRLLTIILSLS